MDANNLARKLYCKQKDTQRCEFNISLLLLQMYVVSDQMRCIPRKTYVSSGIMVYDFHSCHSVAFLELHYYPNCIIFVWYPIVYAFILCNYFLSTTDLESENNMLIIPNTYKYIIKKYTYLCIDIWCIKSVSYVLVCILSM